MVKLLLAAVICKKPTSYCIEYHICFVKMFEIILLFTVLCPHVFRVEDLRDSTAHAEIVCIREASNKLKSWRLAVVLHTHSFMFFGLDCVEVLQKNSILLNHLPFKYFVC
jgi:hypothetical protein